MTFTSCRPPRMAFVTLEMLKIVEGFDVKAMGAQSADALHLTDRGEEACSSPTAIAIWRIGIT